MESSDDDRRRGALCFYRRQNNWFCNAGLPSDIVIEIDDISFHLHKFPITSKCGKLLKMLSESNSKKQDSNFFTLPNCPGGPAAFLLAAKFCYGVRVDHTPEEIINAHCVADYLQMTEDYGYRNLLATSDRYFHTHVVRSWEGCVSALQSFKIDDAVRGVAFVDECLNALSKMVRADSGLVGGRGGNLHSPGGSILWNGIHTGARINRSSTASHWWFHDVSRLSFPLFERLMEKVKNKGVILIPSEELAGAIIYYSRRHLPGIDRSSRTSTSSKTTSLPSSSSDQKKCLVEGIERLFPPVKGKSYCGFLLGLLRLSMILNASPSCKDSLVRRIGAQLEFATLDGLLIPSFSSSSSSSSSGCDHLYNTDCVERIFRCADHDLTTQLDFDVSDHSTAKLVDSYLAEVAPDVNLKPEKMSSLAVALPRDLRSCEDGIYRALDIYFMAHPWVSEKERENLCCILDYEKLSIEAFAHATQNERLPMRVVVQVLFFDQLRLRRTVHSRLELERQSTSDSGGRLSSVMRADMEAMRLKMAGLEQEMAGIKQRISRTTRSWPDVHQTRRQSVYTRLGCTPRPSNSIQNSTEH